MPLPINDLNHIDLATVTTEDLQFKWSTATAKSTGKGYWKKTTYRTGMETRIGNIEIGVWIKAAEAVIHRDGLDEELEHMTAFYYENNETPAFTREELYRASVGSTLFSLYKDPEWFWFVPYNRKHHPELLAAAHLIEVVADCCQAQATYTEEGLTRAGDHIHCPSCRTWTTYHRAPGTKEVSS